MIIAIIILSIITVISLSTLVILVWYIKKIFALMEMAKDSSLRFFTYLQIYREHLKSVERHELYIGDPLFDHLINHTKDLLSLLHNFNEKGISFFDPEIMDILEALEDENDDGDEDEEEQEGKNE